MTECDCECCKLKRKLVDAVSETREDGERQSTEDVLTAVCYLSTMILHNIKESGENPMEGVKYVSHFAGNMMRYWDAFEDNEETVH